MAKFLSCVALTLIGMSMVAHDAEAHSGDFGVVLVLLAICGFVLIVFE